MPSKMGKGVKKARRDDTDFTQYKDGGKVNAAGNYTKPSLRKRIVSEDFLPDLVVHFWSPQAFRERWLLANALITYIHRQRLCISWLLTALYGLTTDLRQYPVLQQP